MDGHSERAFDLAIEINRQISSISTGVIALLTVFFSDEKVLSLFERSVLAVSIVAFGGAVLLGVMILMNATGRAQHAPPAKIIVKGDFKFFVGAQIVAFMVGVGTMVTLTLARLLA